MKEIPIQKNEDYVLEITALGSGGEGIGKLNGFTIFVPNALVGDTAKVKMIKVKKSFAYGKLIEILNPSEDRVEPNCEVALKCGGCQLQHMSYKAQLTWKQKKVQDALERIGGLKDIDVLETLGMEEPIHYRNKAQYPIRKEDGKVQIGFFAARSHRIVPSENCTIEHQANRPIIKVVKAFLESQNISIYDEESHKGLVRHLVIKTAYFTSEKMVILVINGEDIKGKELLIKGLKARGVTSIFLCHNTKRTNVILQPSLTLIHGRDHILDKIGDLAFQISPLSFFQVNPLQTKVLYEKALEYADLKGEETVWDAYCGIGTISLFLAQKAKQVYGVEIVEQAIQGAKENAKLNGITNANFFAGKAEEVIPNLYEEGVKANVIVVDPPRKGCDEKLLQTIVKMSPEKVVYVSCDPATLARDLKYLTREGYQVEKVQPVDMFPHSTHVETVVLMSRVKVNTMF
jgi:23S rRNA (uracil1939-C5)-methyltransferase